MNNHNHHNHHNHAEPRQDEPPAVNIINARKSYYIGKMEVPILHGIDLTIRRGEFLAITGPSGSGKSTLMNLIGCLDLPTGGEVINDVSEIRGQVYLLYQAT